MICFDRRLSRDQVAFALSPHRHELPTQEQSCPPWQG